MSGHNLVESESGAVKGVGKNDSKRPLVTGGPQNSLEYKNAWLHQGWLGAQYIRFSTGQESLVAHLDSAKETSSFYPYFSLLSRLKN